VIFGRPALLVAALATAVAAAAAPGEARADGKGIFAASCVQGYAKAFAEIGGAAGELRLKLDNAQELVAKSFKERPPRCEAGAYDYYLDQLMAFVRRALRSGATPQSPKEGWVRAAASMMDFSPRLVPRAEYYADMQRFQAMRKELISLVVEAGAGPLPSALTVAFERTAPAPGAYGPPAAPPPSEPAQQPQPSYQAPAQPSYQAPAQPSYQAPAQPAASTVPSYINFPRDPLPDWAVINLHELRDLLRSGRVDPARAKLEQVIRWVEQR
jgi:hypothetical protein